VEGGVGIYLFLNDIILGFSKHINAIKIENLKLFRSPNDPFIQI
jgi:hypothetical protein